MAILVGIDGCPKGWICISMDSQTRDLDARVHESFQSLFTHANLPQVIAVDIPVGLTDGGPRTCDLLARKMLGTRGSCVFPAPLRPALLATTREAASEIRVGIEGKRVSCQSFAIYAKIAEVDAVLRSNSNARSITHEVHPEVSFCAMNGGQAMRLRKKTPEGLTIRKRLIEEAFGPDAFDEVRSSIKRSHAADDDILDAFAALWTAIRVHEGTAYPHPGVGVFDSAGLAMRIWA